jgi:GNAT superfamily N-acetyltransferase
MSWKIRAASKSDIPVLVEFNLGCARDSEGKELDRTILTGGVTRGLQQGDEVLYLLAENDNGPIGQIMLTREWSDWRNGWIAWIQSVYVRPEFRGQGVFRSLLDHAVQRLKNQPDVIGVRLYVEQGNASAESVYIRTGFVDPNYKVLELMFRKR